MTAQIEMFGANAPPESSAGAEATPAPPPAAEQAAILCKWCGISPATTIVYGWPTCPTCNTGRSARVRGYCGRLERAAR